MTLNLLRPSTNVIRALSLAIALVLIWRVLAAGANALQDDAVMRVGAALDDGAPDASWRARVARDPTDAHALLVLGLELERAGGRADADAAIRQALRLAPADRRVLLESAGFQLRGAEYPRALPLMHRLLDLYPDAGIDVWPTLTDVLERGASRGYFVDTARENPAWWPAFFRHACASAVDERPLETVFLARAEIGVVSNDERACMIGRLQQHGAWDDAYQLWLASLPAAQKREVGHVFNGNFEWPLSNLGFDWRLVSQDGVNADALPMEGANGRRALRVTFVNKRYSGPPVYQYLMLAPGSYRLSGAGRPDGLETWVGLQWGLYCVAATTMKEPLQLARSERFLGSADWIAFGQDFVVPADCTTQVLRLEMANPRRDADKAGNVAARFRGTLWLDDIKVVALD